MSHRSFLHLPCFSHLLQALPDQGQHPLPIGFAHSTCQAAEQDGTTTDMGGGRGLALPTAALNYLEPFSPLPFEYGSLGNQRKEDMCDEEEEGKLKGVCRMRFRRSVVARSHPFGGTLQEQNPGTF